MNTASVPDELAPREVHTWLAGPPGDPPAEADFDILSEDERARARRFRFDRDRTRFVHAHAALRRVLGRYTGCDPAGIVFTTGEHGKPALYPDLSRPPLHFNLSHSRHLAAVAVARDREVGVDIQHTRERFSVRDIIESCFSAGEADALRRVPEPERQSAFYRCWTRKEAVLKAIGTGLTTPLNAFEVSVDGVPRIVRTAWDPDEARRWTLADLDVPDGYAAAVATEGNDWTLVEHRAG
jgi:4'-phosphopantetheinyl transferase